MTVNYAKAPFPWAGGKSRAAPTIWAALGDVAHYAEPFAGSLAVLLNRPHTPNRPYFSETVNDLDGLLVNAWRAIQLEPDATADAASWLPTEADIHARHCALIEWRETRELEHLMGDPTFCDPTMAGWWLYGIGMWIGGNWAHGHNGPWWPDHTGRLTHRRDRAAQPEEGVSRQLPQLSDDGAGVHRPQLREEGVTRGRPYLHDNGRGVHRPQLREEGVSRQLPHLTSDGRGVHRPQLREEGAEYHPVTMPELRAWFGWLSARLRHVRVVNGDWERVVTPAASITLSCDKTNPSGVLLDPPYAASAGRAALYAVEDFDVAHAVADWAIANGDNPLRRIVMCGYDTEHGDTTNRFVEAGWTEHEWFTEGFLTGGFGNQNKQRGHQQGRERIWLSPHCIQPTSDRQLGLFDTPGGTP